MKHKGKLTISRPQYSDGTKLINISLIDDDANIQFVDVEIPYDEFTEVITGMSRVNCNFEVRNLSNVGKVKEQRDISVPIEDDYNKENRIKNACIELDKVVPKGWSYSTYFNSQNSFTKRDDVLYANTCIFRWVDKES